MTTPNDLRNVRNANILPPFPLYPNITTYPQVRFNPRRSFEAYNPYRPAMPPLPPPPEPPFYDPLLKSQGGVLIPFGQTVGNLAKKIPNMPIFRQTPFEKQQWRDELQEPILSGDYADWAGQGFTDSSIPIEQRVGQDFNKNMGNIYSSFLEEAKLKNLYNFTTADGRLNPFGSSFGEFSSLDPQFGVGVGDYVLGSKGKTKWSIDKADVIKADRNKNALQLGAHALIKSIGRSSQLGEDITSRAMIRRIPDALGAEGLITAATYAAGIPAMWQIGGKLGAHGAKVAAPSLKEAWKNASKTGSLKIVDTVEDLKSPLANFGQKLFGKQKIIDDMGRETEYKVSEMAIQKLGKSVLEPIIPNSPITNFGLELGAETIYYASEQTYGDSKKYHNMGTWSALGTAGLTMAGGMVKLGTAASALKLASVDNIAKNEILKPPTKYHASNKHSSLEAENITKHLEDQANTSINIETGHISNPDMATKKLIISNNIGNLLSSDYSFPSNYKGPKDLRIKLGDSMYYPASSQQDLQRFKNTLTGMTPEIKQGYEKDLLLNQGDIKFDNLWEKSKIIKTINGKQKTVVDLMHLEQNISSENIIAREIDSRGLDEQATILQGNTAVNLEMIKAFFAGEIPLDDLPLTSVDILLHNRKDNELNKLLYDILPNNKWENEIKPLIKYMRDHDVKTYDNLAEEEKVIIREEFVKRFQDYGASKSPSEIVELLFHPFYYFEPRISGNYSTNLKAGLKLNIPTNQKFFTNLEKFNSLTYDELLDNPYMRLFAISKLFREHKTYFEFANNTSRIEELVNNKKLFYNPLESHIKERGKYHGFSKLLDPEYGVTDNEAVNNGLAFLKSFHDTKLKIKEKDKVREISAYFEMPDSMLWGSKHSEYSLGNIDSLTKAADLEINIPMHTGPSTTSQLSSAHAKSFSFADATILSNRGITEAVGGYSRAPIALGRSFGSPFIDPDIALFIGKINPNEYLNYNSVSFRGKTFETVMGGLGSYEMIHQPSKFYSEGDEYMQYGLMIDQFIKEGYSQSEAENLVAEIHRLDNLNTQIPFDLFKKQTSSFTSQLSPDPMSNASKINRMSGRVEGVTGGSEGYKHMYLQDHHGRTGIIGWDRKGMYELEIDGEIKTALSLEEVQNDMVQKDGTQALIPDTDTGVKIEFETNEPMSVKDNINTVKDSIDEFSNIKVPEVVRKSREIISESGGALDKLPISGTPNQTLFSIFSHIRSAEYSKNVIDNFKSNYQMIATNDTQLKQLDSTLGNKLLAQNTSSYASFKSISDTNKSAEFYQKAIKTKLGRELGTNNEISFSGGLSKEVDEDVKAFIFATLEFYMKSIIAPHVSHFYKNSLTAMSNVYTSSGASPDPILKELLLDMGYENLHDYKNWLSNDWILKHNNKKDLGQKIIKLFEYLNPNTNKSTPLYETYEFHKKYDYKLDYPNNAYKFPLELNFAEEFGNFKIIHNENNPSLIKFASNNIDAQIMPWLNKAELIKFFNSPVNKEAYEFYTKRFRSELYAQKSNYINEPRRIYHHVKHFIETAIKEDHDYIVIPTATELVERNFGTAARNIPIEDQESATFFRKIYEKKIPNALKLIMKLQYGVDIKIEKDFWKNIPGEDDVGRSQVKNIYESQLKKEGVLSSINDKVTIMKIPQKLKDDYIKTGNIPNNFFMKSDGGEIKAGIYFKVDGKHLLAAFNDSADLGTMVHEIGHILRRDLDDTELKIVNDYFGIKDGEWTRDAEEKFADALEDYYLNNRVPNPSLTAPFRKLLKIIGYFFKTHVYADLIHGKGKAKFDKLLDQLLPEIPDNESAREFLQSNEMKILTERMAEAFNTTIEQSRSVMASIQARALAWADETGGDPSDWWKDRGFDLVDKEEIPLKDFKKINTDVLDEELTDNPISMVGSQKFNSVLDKVITLLRKAPKERDKIKEQKSKKLKQAVAKMHNEYSRSVDRDANGIDDPQDTFLNARAHLMGTGVKNNVFDPIAEMGTDNKLIPKVDSPEDETLLGDEIATLFNELILQKRADKLSPLDANNAAEALTKILLGYVPNNYEIKLLGKAFGPEGERMSRIARKKKSSAFGIAGATYKGILDDLLRQSPLAFLSSIDVSAVMRQAWFTTMQPSRGKQTIEATWKMLQALISGNRTKSLHTAITSDPYFEMLSKSGLEIIEPDTTSQLTEWKRAFGRSPEAQRERELMSYFDQEIEASGEEIFGGGGAVIAKLFPIAGQFIKMSERAYSTFLNLIRFEMAKSQYLAAKKRGYIHTMDPDLKKPVIDDEERAIQIAKGNIVETYNDLYYEPEELGYKALDDYEIVAISDLSNISTGAGRLNAMYELDSISKDGTFQVKPRTRFVRVLATLFWSPKLVVSRFKMILGAPLFEIRNQKRLGVGRTEEPLSASIKKYIKYTKNPRGPIPAGTPYWAGIEMTGTAFFGNSPIAKKLKGTRFYNGEGFNIGIGGWKQITIPDIGIRMMLIPGFISSSLTTLAAFYGIKQHFKNNNINGSVELDPTATDFGKVTIGNTKFDVLGGNAQAIRFIANMYTGRKKSSGTRNEREMERKDIIEQFVRSKASPPIGTLYSSMIKEETFTGEPWEWDKDLWETMIAMNPSDTYEIIANNMPENNEGQPFSKIAHLVAMIGATSLGAGANTYSTADDVVRGYFINKDGSRYRYTDMEPYMQSVANTVIPVTKEITGSLGDKEKTIEEIMQIWLEELPEAEGTKRGDLNAHEIADARLYLLQRLVAQDENGYWIVKNNNVIKKATDPDTNEISTSALGYALFQEVWETVKEFEDTKNGMYNQKFGAGEPSIPEDKLLDPKYMAKKEYSDIQKAARALANAPAGYDPLIFDPLKKEWEDKYAPKLSELKDEDGKFTEAAIKAIENNPSILDKYVTEEWKYTIRNTNRSPIPIGIIYTIQDFGVLVDGSKSSYSKVAWEKWVLPQILREQHIKTYNFKDMPSNMLNIPVAKDHQMTPDLLQKMLYYNVYINLDGTTSYALPIE